MPTWLETVDKKVWRKTRPFIASRRGHRRGALAFQSSVSPACVETRSLMSRHSRTCNAQSHGLACACSQRGDGLGRASPEAMCTAGAVAGDTRAPGQQSPRHGQGCTAAPCEHCADCRDVFLHRDSGVDPASTARRLGPAPRPPEKNLFFSMKIKIKPSFFSYHDVWKSKTSTLLNDIPNSQKLYKRHFVTNAFIASLRSNGAQEIDSLTANVSNRF